MAGEFKFIVKVVQPHSIHCCYFSAIALDAANPVFYCNRAAAFSRIGEYQKAIDDCNQAIRYDPNYGKGKNISDDPMLTLSFHVS